MKKQEIAKAVYPLKILLALSIILLGTTAVTAAANSPFVGHWIAVDIDESNMDLTIGGRPSGPFQITLTDDYISYCDGGAGIIRGTGLINPDNANLLEADLLLECFASEIEPLNFHMTFRHHQSSNTLSSRYDFGAVTIWHRPGGGQPQEPTNLDLRISYQENWVESFYEAGHTVWITITEPDGVSVKAITEVSTDEFPEGGFNTGYNPEAWFPEPPEIEPNDWVYAWVDNGASSLMQVGEFHPSVDLVNNIVEGTISAPWFDEDVFVYCVVWGTEEGDTDTVLPNGEDTFICDWDGMVDIQAGDVAEIWYWGSDGHAVGYYIFIPNPLFTVHPEGRWFEGYGWPDSEVVSITVEGKESCNTQGQSWDSFFNVGFQEGCDIAVGDNITFAYGDIILTHTVKSLAITEVNMAEDMVSGTAEDGNMGHAWVHEFGYDVVIEIVGGHWTAYFGSEDFHLMPGMCGRVEITDDWKTFTASDWCIPMPEIRVWPVSNRVEGYQWPLGEEISLYINDFETPLDVQTAFETEWGTFVSFDLGSWVLEPGQEIWMVGGGIEKFHTIPPVSITSVDVDLNAVFGTSSPGANVILCVYQGGCEPPTEIFDEDEDGFWAMVYGGTLDIQLGFGMDATEFDGDGDGTSYEYWIPWYILQAYAEWANSGIYLNAGETITVEAYGEATTAYLDVSPGSVSGPDGQDVTCPDPGNMADCAMNGAPYGALVGKIGVEGMPFFIGSYQQFTAGASGELYLAVNDNLGYYDDNGGEYLIYIVDWGIPEPNVWRDDFDGSLAGEWSWINENAEMWNLTEQPGFLRLYTSQYPTGGENLLLRSAPEGNFIIETHLLFEPDTNFQIAGLVIYQDGANFLQLGRAFCNIEESCVGNGIYFDHAQDGIGVGGNFATISDPSNEVYLRLVRVGEMVTGYFSPDGESWTEIGTHWLLPGFQINGIGLTTSQDFYTPEWNIPADFDYFELTEY